MTRKRLATYVVGYSVNVDKTVGEMMAEGELYPVSQTLVALKGGPVYDREERRRENRRMKFERLKERYNAVMPEGYEDVV